MNILRRIAAWLSAESSQRRYETREMAEMEAYLSQAQSLAELEHLQRNWDRARRASLLSPMAFAR